MTATRFEPEDVRELNRNNPEELRLLMERERAALEELVYRHGGSVALQVLPNSTYQWLGFRCWPHSYAGGVDDDVHAVKKLTAWAANHHEHVYTLLQTHIGQHMALCAARWVDQGCPRVIVDSKYASLLMATDIGAEAATAVVAPWKAFLIELPFDWFAATDLMSGRCDPIKRIWVHQRTVDDDVLWDIEGVTRRGMAVWRSGLHAGELASHDVLDDPLTQLTSLTVDKRLHIMLGRLVASACLAMSDPTNLRKQKTSHGRGTRPRVRRTPGAPDIQTYVLGKPLQINCRQAIVDYLAGNTTARNSPTVQTLVRGHWKHQVHGPGRAARKLIHIEPYWRGPDGAPILIRPTHLSAGET